MIQRAALLAAFAAFPFAAQAQVLMEPNVSIRMALTIATTALDACTTRATVVVTDHAGQIGRAHV